MSDLPSSLSKIQIESTITRSPVSESLIQTIGSSVNALIDRVTDTFPISSSCGTFTTHGGIAAITNFSVNITTVGGAVQVWFQNDASGANSGIRTFNNGAGSTISSARVTIKRGATLIMDETMTAKDGDGDAEGIWAAGSIRMVDTAVIGVPGTYTYTGYLEAAGGGTVLNAQIFNSVMAAREL